ncbi:pinin-like isoform X2 [Oppia nitens]|uniref:pinin-like isoform X2 n=1 Tax=Oppia nitens TaxID=1686743 RepID=UPI0023DAEB31|nr:pinin-like isoform X2 [Oppia nitens]
MTAKVFNVFANLETEFLEAKKSLKDVDESIKRVTGREPNNFMTKVVKERSVDRPNRSTASLASNYSKSNSVVDEQSYEPQRKRRFYGNNMNRSRISERESSNDFDEPIRKPTVQSSVVAPTREVKPRTQALEEQKKDKSLARNKRMFGMILGTLQKFQNEESSKRDTQTMKRVEIEKKLDEKAEQEKIALKKERRELFLIRREKEAQIRRIEHKMERVEIHREWERSHQHLSNYIQTKTKPNIFYLPAKQTPETEKRLQESKDKYRLIVAEKRAKVQKELAEIDELYKKEEQNDVIDEEMEDVVNDESNAKENNTDEHKNDDQNDEKLSVNETNINSNHISDDLNKTQLLSESINANTGEHSLNGSIIDNASDVKMQTNEESIGDKEFEPIYDE